MHQTAKLKRQNEDELQESSRFSTRPSCGRIAAGSTSERTHPALLNEFSAAFTESGRTFPFSSPNIPAR